MKLKTLKDFEEGHIVSLTPSTPNCEWIYSGQVKRKVKINLCPEPNTYDVKSVGPLNGNTVISLNDIKAEAIKWFHQSDGNKHKFIKRFFNLTESEIKNA